MESVRNLKGLGADDGSIMTRSEFSLTSEQATANPTRRLVLLHYLDASLYLSTPSRPSLLSTTQPTIKEVPEQQSQPKKIDKPRQSQSQAVQSSHTGSAPEEASVAIDLDLYEHILDPRIASLRRLLFIDEVFDRLRYNPAAPQNSELPARNENSLNEFMESSQLMSQQITFEIESDISKHRQDLDEFNSISSAFWKDYTSVCRDI